MEELASGGSAHPGPDGQAAANDYVANRAILRAKLTWAEKVLLIAIADRAGCGRSVCIASIEGLVEMTTMNERMLRKRSKHLADAGWITVQATLTEEGDSGPNQVRMGPRYKQAVMEQLGRELDQRKRAAQPPKTIMGGVGAPRTPPPGATDPTVGAPRTPRWGRHGPHGGGATDPLTSSLNGSPERTLLTSSSSSTPPGEKRDDEDDVRCAPQEEERPPEIDQATLDFEGADLVTQIVWKCPHVAKLDFRVPAELGRRHGHDWTGLAIAVIYLNRKIDDKEVIPERIETPLNYLLGVLKDIRSPVFPPGELEELGRKVEYLQKSEAQLLLERLESDYGVTVSPNLNWGYESVDPGQSWLPIDFIRELPSDVRNKVKENARQMIRIVGRKKAENEHKTLETSDRRRAL